MFEENDAPSSIAKVSIEYSNSPGKHIDSVVVEEPLEIRIKQNGREYQLGITMRTPGADIDLAAGFLWGEGIVTSPEQLISIKVCGDRGLTPRQRANIVIAEISDPAPGFAMVSERNFMISSACGVCGSTNVSDLHKRGIKKVPITTQTLNELARMTELFRGRQSIFERTGGLHAALLVDGEGDIRWSREDVGRHNAVDKVIGAALTSSNFPLRNWTLVVSGRVGYEVVQKAVVAGVSALVGVSAPTSLAVELAKEFELTLLAFAREGNAKKYSPLLG